MQAQAEAKKQRHRLKKETPFNYNLKQMQLHVDSPSVSLPKELTNPDDILRWMLAQ